jgi:hypothetical protein
MNEWNNAKLCDVGNLILGVFLFFTPWMFRFPAGMQSQNAMVSGIIIAVLSIAALAAFTIWEEWLNLIVGLWLILSPWALEFQLSPGLRADATIGFLVAVLAIGELWARAQTPSRQVANRRDRFTS